MDMSRFRECPRCGESIELNTRAGYEYEWESAGEVCVYQCYVCAGCGATFTSCELFSVRRITLTDEDSGREYEYGEDE